MEWPPRSGKIVEFPEVDRGAWFSIHDAHDNILPSQSPMLFRLVESVGLHAKQL
jgi:predicted NUDIX family NTP pyrophosphohydrolase